MNSIFLLLAMFFFVYQFIQIIKGKQEKDRVMQRNNMNSKPHRVVNTHVENKSDPCGIDHEEPYEQRYCPFCGSKVKQDAAICPSCHHEI